LGPGISDFEFRATLGAVTLGHPPIRPFRVAVTSGDHPIMEGVSDFIVTDEQHFMIYEQDPSHVLMRSENLNQLDHEGHGASCEAGWAFELGEGRVCCLAPGHMISVLWNPEYEKVRKNAVRWLLREV